MKFPYMDQKSFIASPASGNESWKSKKVNSTLSLNWSMPYQGGCFQVLISSRCFWFVHLRLEKKILLVWDISPLSHWVFSNRFPMRPSCPTPQGLRPVRHPSKFTPRTERIRGTILVRLYLQIDGFLTGPFAARRMILNHEPNGTIGPLNGCPKRLS